MAHVDIFCNAPWYEIHIYWDGSLGICSQESRKLYADSSRYNIKTMTLSEWVNSPPAKKFRSDILSNTKTDICNRCYHEEAAGGSSKRNRSNQKSVIFGDVHFDKSFNQSPGQPHFRLSEENGGTTDTLPIDMHIDLGNYCNLACKMCKPDASSTIAAQHVKLGDDTQRKFLGSDWTKDRATWDKLLDELLTIPKLQNIHFMGG